MVLALPFLKMYLFGGRKISIRDYFLRRLTRLEPPFIITLVGFYFVHILVLNSGAINLLPNLLTGLLYLHVPIFGYPNPINPVTWSLETEAQFYVIVPLLFSSIFWIKNIYFRILFVILLFGTSIYLRGYFLTEQIGHLSNSIFAYLSNFIVGGIFAYGYLREF